MKIKNLILCAGLLLLVAGCNQAGTDNTNPNTNAVNAPPGVSAPAVTNSPATTNK